MCVEMGLAVTVQGMVLVSWVGPGLLLGDVSGCQQCRGRVQDAGSPVSHAEFDQGGFVALCTRGTHTAVGGRAGGKLWVSCTSVELEGGGGTRVCFPALSLSSLSLRFENWASVPRNSGFLGSSMFCVRASDGFVL